MQVKYDIIVVGGGHAGAEAALIAARMGVQALLITSRLDSIAQMPCNPSIGGLAKSHLVYLVEAIMANKMWFNLVEQINVLPNQGIEIVPRVGNHVVYLGQLPRAKQNNVRRQLITEMINSKMTRLEKFYRYGLSQAGWNKYKYINLEFDNQIVCKK